MSAVMKADQLLGAGVGANGKARKDLWVSREITLTETGAGNTTWAWTMLRRPHGSAAALAGATTQSPTFTPDRQGTYRIRCVVDAGLPTEDETIKVFRVRYSNTGVLVNRGYVVPAVDEKDGESNYDIDRGFGSQVNDLEWGEPIDYFMEDVHLRLSGIEGGGGGTPYDSTPTTVGTAAASAGSSDNYARGDHQHALDPTAATQAELDTATTNIAVVTSAHETRLDAIEDIGWVLSRVDGEDITPGSVTVPDGYYWADGAFATKVFARTGTVNLAAAQAWAALGPAIELAPETTYYFAADIAVAIPASTYGSGEGAYAIAAPGIVYHTTVRVTVVVNTAGGCTVTYKSADAAADGFWRMGTPDGALNTHGVYVRVVDGAGTNTIQIEVERHTGTPANATTNAKVYVALRRLTWDTEAAGGTGAEVVEFLDLDGNAALDEDALLDVTSALSTDLDVGGRQVSNCAGVSRTGGGIWLSTTTSGNIVLDSAGVLDMDAVGAASLNAAAINLGAPSIEFDASTYIAIRVSGAFYGVFLQGSYVAVRTQAGVERFVWNTPGDASITTATTTTIGAFSPLATRVSTYKVTAHMWDASGNARIWQVYVDAILVGGVAKLSAGPPSGAAATRTIETPVAATLTINTLGANVQVQLITTDTTTQNASVSVEEVR